MISQCLELTKKYIAIIQYYYHVGIKTTDWSFLNIKLDDVRQLEPV